MYISNLPAYKETRCPVCLNQANEAADSSFSKEGRRAEYQKSSAVALKGGQRATSGRSSGHKAKEAEESEKEMRRKGNQRMKSRVSLAHSLFGSKTE